MLTESRRGAGLVGACLWGLLLAGAMAGEAGPASDAAPAVSEAIRKVYPALVRIYVVGVQPVAGRMRKYQGSGSGVIISPDGYVVTNHHVAGKSTRLICTLPDEEEIDAELVGADPLSDIAVLRLKLAGRPKDAKPIGVAFWGDSDRVRVGDTVYAMGSPAAIAQSVTKGIVANPALILPGGMSGSLQLDGENVGSIVRWIAHDARIFPGNSGGPLVNEAGQVIGINEIGFASLGGAIPSDLARDVAEQIIAKGHVERSWLGIEVQPRLKSGAEKTGILIGGVVAGSPAAKAGVEPGDVMTSFDGAAVDCEIAEQVPLFNRLVLGTPVGKTVKVEVLRQGKPLTLELTTALREPALPEPGELKGWGITARSISRAMALEMRRPSQDGVLVDSLRQGGPAAEAKPALASGDVIVRVAGQPVKDYQALAAFSREATRGKDERVPVLVEFDRAQARLMTVVKIGREEPPHKPLSARKAWPAAETQVLTRDLAAALALAGRTGVRVTRVYEGRAAEKAGLKVGDIILAVDGRRIEASQPEDSDVYQTMIGQYRIGSVVKLDIVRDGKPEQIEMTLEAPPQPADLMKRLEDDDFEFTARDLSFRDRADAELAPETQGVLIEQVEQGGWAALAGLRGGDVLLTVDAKAVPDTDALKRLLDDIKKQKPRRTVFFVRRGVHTFFTEVEPEWDDAARK